ncbi:hypothetical protein BGZ65_003078 [Modicella reniformis]|uniref:NAD(+) kinase n=1 Tax=Modicella reniformis TaxID=1440133 RepID=A0A9P6STR7_9FUNG|nr:hypothetical protein BGZ65_003078 [Modicella reniformis]
MTPTSRLAESVVGVREVSKKIARVKWETPKSVMIVTKPGDESLLKITREIALWMIRFRGLTVYVDEKMKDLPKFRYPSFLKSSKLDYDFAHALKFWTSDLCAQEAHLFDFVITLGGDGTVLFTSWLFQRIVPPILPFSAGSLGFLTPFQTVDYQKTLGTCLDHGVRVSLRMRFSCTIYRCLEHRVVDTTKKKKRKGNRHKSKTGSPNRSVSMDESDDESDVRRGLALPTVLTTPTETFEILNDLVLDRGPSANLSLLELFGDEEHLTTVQADGIVISTPTGSTAYSLAAGGPLSHPEIPAILISPICPHTLSFRPMLLPDSMELRICVPFDSRSTAWASFDGRGRVELKQGDHIKVTASLYPFPTICSSTQSSDWFHSLSRCLRWNERERQKGFRVVEHGRSKKSMRQTPASPPAGGKPSVVFADPSTQSSLNTLGVHNNKSSQDLSQHSPSHHDQSSGSTTSGQGHGHGYHQGTGYSRINNHSQGYGHSHSHSHGHGHGHGHDSHLASGSNSAGHTKGKQGSSRLGGGGNHDDPNHSPQDTDTMLTYWGTDSDDSDSDDSDEESDPMDEKDDAADGDGEWEESSSDDSDDDDYCDKSTMDTDYGKASGSDTASCSQGNSGRRTQGSATHVPAPSSSPKPALTPNMAILNSQGATSLHAVEDLDQIEAGFA